MIKCPEAIKSVEISKECEKLLLPANEASLWHFRCRISQETWNHKMWPKEKRVMFRALNSLASMLRIENLRNSAGKFKTSFYRNILRRRRGSQEGKLWMNSLTVIRRTMNTYWHMSIMINASMRDEHIMVLTANACTYTQGSLEAGPRFQNILLLRWRRRGRRRTCFQASLQKTLN